MFWIQEATCEFLECPASQTCVEGSPPKCVAKSPSKDEKSSENSTNEKLDGRNLVETQGTLETGLVQTPSTHVLPWIIVVSVVGSIIVIGLITFVAVLRSRRRATGTYRWAFVWGRFLIIKDRRENELPRILRLEISVIVNWSFLFFIFLRCHQNARFWF